MEKTPGWVIGYIDGYGAVHARFSERNSPHSEQEKHAGRPFRWCVFSQDFCFMTEFRMDKEDIPVVENWLESNGYKEPEP